MVLGDLFQIFLGYPSKTLGSGAYYPQTVGLLIFQSILLLMKSIPFVYSFVPLTTLQVVILQPAHSLHSNSAHMPALSMNFDVMLA
jgi:hypothetical protein